MSIDLTDDRVFISTNRGTIYAWELGDEEGEVVARTGLALSGIAISPAGELFGITETDLYRIDINTNQTDHVGRLTSSTVLYLSNYGLSGATGFDISSSGQAVISTDYLGVFTVDLDTAIVDRINYVSSGGQRDLKGGLWFTDEDSFSIGTDYGRLLEFDYDGSEYSVTWGEQHSSAFFGLTEAPYSSVDVEQGELLQFGGVLISVVGSRISDYIGAFSTDGIFSGAAIVRDGGGTEAHDCTPVIGQKTLANSAEDVRLATFLAHTVYGDWALPDTLNGRNDDNGLDDNYRAFLAGNGWSVMDQAALGTHYTGDNDADFLTHGLFEGRFSFGFGWDAQALLARGETLDGCNTLVFAFRGTDEDDPAFLGGQAWTGGGLYRHYVAHQPLIDAMISYANDPSNGIDKVIVGGHSLGGSMVDIFASLDAQRLDVDVTTVGLASAGVDPDTFTDSQLDFGFDRNVDPSVVSFGSFGSVSLAAPGHYIGIAHSQDRVTYETINPLGLTSLVPVSSLAENEGFDPVIDRLDLPYLVNDDVDYDSFFFSKGFGAEHNGGLYWANIKALTEDPLITAYQDHTIIMGRTDYDEVGDLTDGDLAVFDGYLRANNPTDANDRPLLGGAGRDYILGMGGNDFLVGGAGNDLLSGGDGDDVLNGGTGADTMSGGLGNDIYIIDNPGDVIVDELAYSLGGGIDTVRVFINNYVQPDNQELVRLGEITDTSNLNVTGNDAPGTLVGNAGNNQLTGRGGNDQLNGNNGDDSITGNTGRDTVVGGNGNDTFVYTAYADSRAGSANRDVINGFTRTAGQDDVIDLSALDANTRTFGVDDAFKFIGSARFSGTAGELRTQGLGGSNAVLVEADHNGDGVADLQLFVNLTTWMTGADFIL